MSKAQRYTLLAILAAGTLIHQPPPVQAQNATALVCSPQRISATGKAFKREKRARNNAANAWQRKTRLAMGRRWNSLRLASSKVSRCYKTGRQTYCEFSAIPCNHGALKSGETAGVEGGRVSQ